MDCSWWCVCVGCEWDDIVEVVLTPRDMWGWFVECTAVPVELTDETLSPVLKSRNPRSNCWYAEMGLGVWLYDATQLAVLCRVEDSGEVVRWPSDVPDVPRLSLLDEDGGT